MELDIIACCGYSHVPFFGYSNRKHHRCCGVLWALDEVDSPEVLDLLVGTVMG